MVRSEPVGVALQGLDLTDKRPIYDHVERFEKGLRLYREEKFQEALKQVRLDTRPARPIWLSRPA